MLPPWPAALSGRLEQSFFTSELLRFVPGAGHEAIGRRQVHSLSWLTGKLSGAGR
jgi:hypothetical protein